MPGKYQDIKGQRFGRLIAVMPTRKRKRECVVWLCQCDCGKLTEVESHSLLKGHTKSCGCLQKEIARAINLKHGDNRGYESSRLYKIWRHMKSRCLNPKTHGYCYYGGKGVSIFIRWQNNYIEFKSWALANGYQDNLTIDRINSDGNYEPGNCQWITKSENSRKACNERHRQRVTH